MKIAVAQKSSKCTLTWSFKAKIELKFSDVRPEYVALMIKIVRYNIRVKNKVRLVTTKEF